MGTRLIEEEPERFAEAERYLLEALEIALEKGNRLRIASTISTLSQARLRHRRDPESLALAEQALDAVEVLQGWQTGGTMGTVLRARYAPQYYELFDALLHEWEAGDVGRLDEAFRVSERYRARALRSHLQRLGVHLELDEDDAARLERTSRAITALQLRLLRGEGTAPERERWSREVSGLEEEMRLLRAAGLTREIRGSLAADDLPSRREVQDTLGAREALLTFMSSTDPASRSWVLVLTPTGLSVHPIPPRRELASAVRLWLGLITERDATATASAARLWKDLLAGPVDALPEGITRLVIVPDGPLHELPFDALRPARDAPSLGERFEISLAPSATVWTALRRARDADAPAEGRGLFFADPWLPRGEETPALLRGVRDELGGLGPLPHARDEARVAQRELGSGIEVLEGRLAREAALKTRSLEGLRILHFAAHSVLDGEIPERSSVLMAPGDGEDGLLQAREILDLELDGVLVALSACRSITGRPVDGEGVLGLSHAFLQAGASAVVGTLWPVRDDEAAVFMREFYARLARGPSPLSALAETKRALAARGAPAAAWAGVVLIGDADAIAWPARSRSGSGRLGILLASIFGLLALAAIARLAIRRRRTGHLAAPAGPPRSSRHDTE
ncbi:MAG: CHAT domain-containing protein [Acidobacteria bacterium]|nr:MAG: CHAT domain-containing protein [Acidobacteriota bacterium]